MSKVCEMRFFWIWYKDYIYEFLVVEVICKIIEEDEVSYKVVIIKK